jgi:competence protein ComEC
MRSKKITSEQTKWLLIALLIVVCVAAVYILMAEVEDSQPAAQADSATLYVLVIDVGQADSLLVTMSTGEVMLIDAGESDDADAIFEELDERRIDMIDILVATHPHADHIGGMVKIVERYEIGAVYMPDKTSESKTYKKLVAAIEARGIPIIEAYAGIRFSLGAAQCTIVSPGRDDDFDANNESVVIFLDYLNTECLFTGDMEEKAEEEVLSAAYMIDADILKVAHHGSSTGTSEAFLEAVSPDYAVISCGEGNSYGHPHEETIDLLVEYGLTFYRTDLSGDILFTSDGHTIRVTTGD